MALKSKSKTTRPKRSKILTKREKAQKRVNYIHKAIQRKRRVRLEVKKKRSTFHQKLIKQGDDQIIQLIEPKQTNQYNNNPISILDILGLGQTDQNHNIDWQQALQNKLKQANQKSLDNPQVRRIYTEIGKIFGTYRSGKIPKAFKIIPNLQKWNQVLTMTHPQNWTPQAMYQAVNIFASNFDPVRAE